MSGADPPPPLPRWITHPGTSSNNMGSSILVTGLISLALVVAVVVFLHLYIRFILRRRLPVTGNRLTAVDFLRFHAPGSIRIEDTAPHSTGLDPSVIAALPSFLYRKPSGSADEGEDAGGGAAECAVCLSAAEEGEVVRLLPNCKHMFHVDCIDMWLASHVTCPVCRAMVEPPPRAAVDGTGEREASAGPAPLTVGTASHEGTTSSGLKEESSSMSSRLSASLRRMLSARERLSSSSSSRRAHGESTEGPLTTGTASHEGTTLSGPKEESSSMSSRLSASLRRMLSARERLLSSSSSRRAHGESTEDLERQ